MSQGDKIHICDTYLCSSGARFEVLKKQIKYILPRYTSLTVNTLLTYGVKAQVFLFVNETKTFTEKQKAILWVASEESVIYEMLCESPKFGRETIHIPMSR